jgi:hypothetical protein
MRTANAIPVAININAEAALTEAKDRVGDLGHISWCKGNF